MRVDIGREDLLLVIFLVCTNKVLDQQKEILILNLKFVDSESFRFYENSSYYSYVNLKFVDSESFRFYENSSFYESFRRGFELFSGLL